MHVNFDSKAPAAEEISFDDFLKVDIRIGTILSVDDFPEARKPSYILKIDFGETLGIKKSSAQIAHYKKEDLVGKKIAAVVNFPARQIGPIKSEVLTLGFSNLEGQVILFSPDYDVPNGSRLH